MNIIKIYFLAEIKKQVVLPTLLSKGKRLSEEHLQVINDEFTREDVKRIMFSIPDERDPKADGFNSKFYKHR